jgi:hypothetical protein
LGAFLILLLNLLVLSGAAPYASAGSTLPIKAPAAVGGGAAQSANSAVQPAVAPVTKAVAHTEQTTAPVTEAGSKEVHVVTAPASSAVTHSASAAATPPVAAPVLGATAQTVRKTVAPTLETTTKTIDATTAPVLETAGKNVDKAAAPVLKTAAPVLDRTEQTVVKAAAPVFQTATRTIGGVAIPVTGKGLSNPPARAARDLSNASSSVVMNAAPPTTPPSPGVLLSGSMPAPHVPLPGIPASAEELLTGVPLLAHPAQIASFAQIASVMESLSTSPTPRNGDYGRRAGTPPSTSVLPAPTPSPLPVSSSDAMASAAGAAFSTFLTLAGLLLMGCLAAMRRLRLASEPRRTAPFVLMPERPG